MTAENLATQTSATDQAELFRSRVAAFLNLDEVRDDMTLAEIGVDSLNIVDLILAAEEVFGQPVDVTELELSAFTTLGDFISSLQPNRIR